MAVMKFYFICILACLKCPSQFHMDKTWNSQFTHDAQLWWLTGWLPVNSCHKYSSHTFKNDRTWGGLQSASAKGLNQSVIILEYGRFLILLPKYQHNVALWIDRMIIIYTHFKILFISVVKTGAKLWNRNVPSF